MFDTIFYDDAHWMIFCPFLISQKAVNGHYHGIKQ